MVDFATRLRELRTARRLRQADLAAAIGVAQTTIANYEQHNRFPDEETLGKIAGYFDVSLDYLLGRSRVELPAERIIQFRYQDAPGPSGLVPDAREYLKLLLSGEKNEAFAFIESRVRSGMSVQEVYRSIFEPALKEVGRLWEINEIDVSQEHYFSRATESLMAQLGPYLRPTNHRRGTIVLVAVGGELHEIGLRMVADFLEGAGFRSVFLGVNTPVAGVVNAVRDSEAHVLAISATLGFSVDTIANMIRRIRWELRRGPHRDLKIITGGQAFSLAPDLWQKVGADGWAPNADEAVDLVARLVPGS